jgi:hypothetical protein
MARVIVSIVLRMFASSFKQGIKKLTSTAPCDACSGDGELISGSIIAPQVIRDSV